MTTIFAQYYQNIDAGLINLQNVNFSAYITDITYVPAENDTKADVTGRVETLVKILVGGDISTLTMSEIIEKITARLQPEELERAARFVVYDIATGDLCFSDTLN